PALDHDRRGGERSAHLGRRLDLDALAGLRVAAVLADDDERAHLDLALHFRALADHERVGRDDLSGELAVDAHRSFEQELALERAALAEQGIQLARSAPGAGRSDRGRALLHLIPAHCHVCHLVLGAAVLASTLNARRQTFLHTRIPNTARIEKTSTSRASP